MSSAHGLFYSWNDVNVMINAAVESRFWRYLLWGIAAVMLSACTSIPSPEERISHAAHLAAQHGWSRFVIQAGIFELTGYAPNHARGNEQLRIYIEGDGLAWVSRSRPSSNPTPVNPMALQLALSDPTTEVIYLARPCQYTPGIDCSSRYWLGERFSPEVIHSYNLALDELKRRQGAQSLTLIGYSGGGAIAALLAARRQDVDGLVTVAGNLDTEYWTRYHRITPLQGSLNPADEVQVLKHVRQWHFVGSDDQIIPPTMVQQFVDRFPGSMKPGFEIVPGYSHHCCWDKNWPALLRNVR
ncbi:alpha/beta hydrolase [Marinobacterium sediminicola]|uniref:Alpha/beta hydrolase family protein n=1 Tax=Marinobacterium sediminicola TaxID=518898 RepID=A0ABY1S4N1_9GAMM|nr:alpha/beta hydrolase [Marinobacterium sediminicola]ULG70109.1 alpha/beta hydrolase [Marinobacterium sediminicola]SMR78384.1 hypothetical protein SAMN04487964_1222 [Marinobacterium sediminicola]